MWLVTSHKEQTGVTIQFRRAYIHHSRKNVDVLCNLHAHTHSFKKTVNASMASVHLLRILMYTGKLIINTGYLTEYNKGYYHRLKLTMTNIR